MRLFALTRFDWIMPTSQNETANNRPANNKLPCLFSTDLISPWGDKAPIPRPYHDFCEPKLLSENYFSHIKNRPFVIPRWRIAPHQSHVFLLLFWLHQDDTRGLPCHKCLISIIKVPDMWPHLKQQRQRRWLLDKFEWQAMLKVDQAGSAESHWPLPCEGCMHDKHPLGELAKLNGI